MSCWLHSVQDRTCYSDWVLVQRLAKLKRFAYTDGTVFYLARSEAELEDKTRLCLGPYVWRMANGKDGLWDANVGPSLYAKARGRQSRFGASLPMATWNIGFCQKMDVATQHT